jgi:hypothetical protein
MPLWYWAFAASAITANCGACLATLLKTFFNADCIDKNVVQTESFRQQSAISFLVCASLTFLTNAAFPLFKSRSKRGWSLIGAICKNWKPVYFFIVSAEKMIFTALNFALVIAARKEQASACTIPVADETIILCAAFLFNLTIFCMGVSVICCDLDDDFTPALRRLAYFLFSICFVLDAIGSYIWGNTLFARRVALTVGSFKFILDNQITSCITSQFVIALHFFFVSFRSKNGRAWAYLPLKFVLFETNSPRHMDPLKTLEHSLLPKTEVDTPTQKRPSHIATSALESLSEDLGSYHALNSGTMKFCLRKHWLRFQRRRMVNCEVFVIPLAANQAGCSDGAGLEIDRPLFSLEYLQPLHRLAEAHPSVHIGLIALLGLSSFVCSVFLKTQEAVGIATLVLNTTAFVVGMGFFSCKRHNLDKVAAKHVASSFRFVVCVVFLAAFVALDARKAFLGKNSPWQAASIAVMTLPFVVSTLADCSPRLSAFSQICISVRLWLLF